MREWAMYYVNFIRQFFSNLWDFIKSIFDAIIKWLFTDIKGYFDDLVRSSGEFKVFDWICYVFVLLINLAFITF